MIALSLVELLYVAQTRKRYGFMSQSDNVQLDKVGDIQPEKNELPRGVQAMILGDRVIFVRRVVGRFVPVSQVEQEELEKKHTS